MNTSSTANDLKKQTSHIVAFLDFLASSNKMKDPNESEIFLEQLEKHYGRALGFFPEISDVEIRIFSDNVIFFKKCVSDDFAVELLDVIKVSALFQSIALGDGLLLRGGITKGNFYASNTFVYGDALVSAYEIESKQAIYPRVIVDRDILPNNLQEIESSIWKEIYRELLRDTDGEYFLNFMAPCIFNDHPMFSYIGFCNRYKKVHDTKNKCALQKYEWTLSKIKDIFQKAGIAGELQKLQAESNALMDTISKNFEEMGI